MKEKAKVIVEDGNNKIYTSVISVAGLVSQFARKNFDFNNVKSLILSLSSFYLIDFELAEEAGKLHAHLRKERKHIGLADALILLTAKKLNAKIVTGDEDFRGMKEVIMIK